jgi:hypothetical protein
MGSRWTKGSQNGSTFLIKNKKKRIRMLPRRPVEAGTTGIPTEEEGKGLNPHLAGNVTFIFLMQVSGWVGDFSTAVLCSSGLPLNVAEGFRQKPCSKQT